MVLVSLGFVFISVNHVWIQLRIHAHTPSHYLCQLWPHTQIPCPPPTPLTKWGPCYRLATREQWAPRRGNGSSKGQAILWRWREGWRDGSQGGERTGRGVMGMVWGHIFNHVTKTEAAWETRLCFSNPAGRFCLAQAHSHNSEKKRPQHLKFVWKDHNVIILTAGL